jgi:hypothetical protein
MENSFDFYKHKAFIILILWKNKMLEFTLLGYCLRRSSFKLRVARVALSPTSWHR